MRLPATAPDVIRSHTARFCGERARVWLFGSRADDAARGGDVDLYVEPEAKVPMTDQLLCCAAIAEALDLDVDLIVNNPGSPEKLIYDIARTTGVRL